MNAVAAGLRGFAECSAHLKKLYKTDTKLRTKLARVCDDVL